VGSSAQTKAMKAVAGRLKLDVAQYGELQAFAQFGTSDLDAATRRQLERGQRTVEVLKQPQYSPLSMPQEVAIVYAVTNGYVDDVPVERVRAFEEGLHKFLGSTHPDILETVASEKALSDATTKALGDAINEFKTTVPY
jgi:F-type H+-transporting ATPase subunit alpha